MNDIQPREIVPATPPPAGTSSKVLRVLATIASYIFHPVFMPVIMALVLYMLSPVSFMGIPVAAFKQWIVVIVLNSVMYPLLTIFLLKKLGFIKSMLMQDAKDRIIPIMAAMIFYFWTDLVFSNNPKTPLILHVLLLGCFWGIIVLFMVNIFFKVSMHTMAAGGMLGVLIVLMMLSPVNMVVPFFIALLIAGIIGTARMLLGAHWPAEIWVGYVLGILVQIGAYIYLK